MPQLFPSLPNCLFLPSFENYPSFLLFFFSNFFSLKFLLCWFFSFSIFFLPYPSFPSLSLSRSVPFLSYLFFFIRSSSPLFFSNLLFRSALFCSVLLSSFLLFSLSPPGHHEVHDISSLCSDMIWFSRLNQLLNLTRNQDRINIMSKEN